MTPSDQINFNCRIRIGMDPNHDNNNNEVSDVFNMFHSIMRSQYPTIFDRGIQLLIFADNSHKHSIRI